MTRAKCVETRCVGWAVKMLPFFAQLGINAWDGMPAATEYPEDKAGWLLGRQLHVARI